jgi:hypothetical protein
MLHVASNTDLLLLSNRIKDVSYNPFCHFQIENYLPATMYQSLQKSSTLFIQLRDPDGVLPAISGMARIHGFPQLSSFPK